jgi:arylsulfatase A-like enzyme
MSTMMERVEKWVSRHGDEGPFFVYLHPMNCHGPYRVPRSHETNLLSRPPSPGFRYYGKIMRDIMRRGKIETRKRVTEAYLQSLQEQYDTAVRYTTDQLGTFFGRLRQNGLWDDTLVVVVADHGEELFDHGGFSHGYSLYNEVVHVPLMIKLPLQQAPIRQDAVVSSLDIYPTILGTLNLENHHRTDGRSLLPFFDTVNQDMSIDSSGDTRALAHRELLLSVDWRGRAVMKSMLNQRFKFVKVKRDYTSRKARKLMFDLKSDPKEKTNVRRSRRKRADQMNEALKNRWDAYSKIRMTAKPQIVEDLNVDALRALGYIE